MYPNPQEALPLAPRPNLEQYRKLAKDLAKACRSADPGAIRQWADDWIARLAAHFPAGHVFRSERDRRSAVDRVAEYAHKEFSKAAAAGALTTAQFVIARALGFLSWPKLTHHIESLGESGSPVSAYEAAVAAIVNGDAVTLGRLLRRHPRLVHARSTREHSATLLHYVAANGVEGFRQISPRNSAEIAEMLLAAGADVDATTDVYESDYTTLGLVATSGPPAVAGVQRDVMDVLLKHGARVDRSSGRTRESIVRDCLANGQPQAAEYLASRGAHVGLVDAAGLGHLDTVKQLVAGGARSATTPARAQLLEAFYLACVYGRTDVVEFLLGHGVDTAAEVKGWGEGATGLHIAAFQGHLDVVTLLLRNGARVDVIDKTWKTTPLTWAMTGWSMRPADAHYDIVKALVAAGASVRPDIVEWDAVRGDPRMHAALTAV
jgi:ankyrin repeat protein